MQDIFHSFTEMHGIMFAAWMQRLFFVYKYHKYTKPTFIDLETNKLIFIFIKFNYTNEVNTIDF